MKNTPIHYIFIAVIIHVLTPGVKLFNGNDYTAINTTNIVEIEKMNNLSLHFNIKSDHIDGLLFLLPILGHYISVEVEFGYLKVVTIINGNKEVLNNGIFVSDNQQHTVAIDGHEQKLTLTVDAIPSQLRSLQHFNRYSIQGIIYIGGTSNNIRTSMNLTENWIGCLNNITLNKKDISQIPQHAIIHGNISQEYCQNNHIRLAYLNKLQSKIGFYETIHYNQSAEYNLTFFFRSTFSQQIELLRVEESLSGHLVRLVTNNNVLFIDAFGFTPLPGIINRNIFDGNWHALSIMLNQTHCRVKLDNDERILISMQSIQNLNATQNRTVTIQFHGCIKNLIWNNQLQFWDHPKFSLTDVLLNTCGVQDYCRPFHPCYNNGTCTNRLDTFQCVCGDASLFSGTRCQDYRYKQSCYDLFRLERNRQDEWVMIDPDGYKGMLQPFPTYCVRLDPMVTTIRHQVGENRYNIPQNDSIGPGAHIIDIHYQDGDNNNLQNISISQIIGLVDISDLCSQALNYYCSRSVLLNYPHQPYVWWVARHGQAMTSWSSAPVGSRKCACGVVDSCLDEKVCNCDADRQAWASDEGTLTSKAYLPVTQLRAGFQSDGILRQSSIQLGSLSCSGRGSPSDVMTLISNRVGIDINLNQQKFSDDDVVISFKGKSINGVLLSLQGLSNKMIILTVSNRQINLTYNLGQGVGQQQLSVIPEALQSYNDDNWHQVRFRLSLARSWLSADQVTSFENTITTDRQLTPFEFDGILTIGYNSAIGVDGYIGCLGDLYIGSRKYNLQQFRRSEVINGCQVPCFQAPCQNFGTCQGNYSVFSCDCSTTRYIGPVCNHIRGAEFVDGSSIIYTANQFSPSQNIIQLSFWTKSMDVEIMNLKSFSNDGQHNEVAFGIGGGRLYLTVNETNFAFEEVNHVKYDDQQRHHVVIDIDRNIMVVDKNELQDIPKLNIFRTLTVQLGDNNNGLGNLCLNNVSVFGLRLLDVAYQSPNNPNLQFIPNRFGSLVKEAVCVNGEIVTTSALSTTAPSTLSSTTTTTSRVTTTSSTSGSRLTTRPTTPTRSSRTESTTVFDITDTVPIESQQATTITVVACVIGVLLLFAAIGGLYWYYIIRPKKKNDVELVAISKDIADGNGQANQSTETAGQTDNKLVADQQD